MTPPTVFTGNIIYTTSPADLVVFSPGCIIVSHDGRILYCAPLDEENDLRKLKSDYGFTESQVTAMTRRTGYDMPLLQWLEKYTFPREAEFRDKAYAEVAYAKCVARTLRCGTTTACYYATIHVPGCKVLSTVVSALGQRAFIGKVNMDRHSPDYYVETTADSMAATTAFVQWLLEQQNPLITPIITPRFVPSCTPALMKFLGDVASNHNLPIQTHLSENPSEVKWVSELHPEFASYAAVYEAFGLLNNRSVLAHCVYLTPEERALIKHADAGVSHCPNSNFLLQSGVLNVRQLLEAGIKVGLGTDVAGGCSPSILDAMRQAVVASKVIYMQTRAANDVAAEKGLAVHVYEPLTLSEVFYLGTLGGAKVMGLDDKIGSFAVGKDFDALLVDLDAGCVKNATTAEQVDGNKTVELFPHDGLLAGFEKFLYNGDDRNVVGVFVKGKQVVPFPPMEL
ncbi:guanine deaminase [Synchytrium endobioticum]|uniref:Guanine deaminase n=1 Tax=Synchytrium endobioticum TaxID=286115 RepID=A0A507DKH3_9FUNG|nr:guanine deaminase [Synchytrium endobioticum]TPX54060.1 guanine deaminase [Synchytrium endobioticum]